MPLQHEERLEHRARVRVGIETAVDCGVRQLVVTGPMQVNFDFSLRKRIPFGSKVTYEFSLDVFNVLNRVNWTPTVGVGSTTLANWQGGLPSSSRTMQIGTRFSW